jgi:hypothetical protein
MNSPSFRWLLLLLVIVCHLRALDGLDADAQERLAQVAGDHEALDVVSKTHYTDRSLE